LKAPETVIEELLKKARAVLYRGQPDRAWFTQQVRVKAALTLPAAWLQERQVEIPAARYQAILEGILDTIRANGREHLGPYPCAYFHHCVESHLAHHGDKYYAEGKGIRNRVQLFMSSVEKARIGADSTVPILAGVHAALDTGKRRKSKAPAPALQPDLFASAKPRKQIGKIGARNPQDGSDW
jgi:hypothetical protein